METEISFPRKRKKRYKITWFCPHCGEIKVYRWKWFDMMDGECTMDCDDCDKETIVWLAFTKKWNLKEVKGNANSLEHAD